MPPLPTQAVLNVEIGLRIGVRANFHQGRPVGIYDGPGVVTGVRGGVQGTCVTFKALPAHLES